MEHKARNNITKYQNLSFINIHFLPYAIQCFLEIADERVLFDFNDVPLTDSKLVGSCPNVITSGLSPHYLNTCAFY